MKAPTEGSVLINSSQIHPGLTSGRILVRDDKETDEKVDKFLKDYREKSGMKENQDMFEELYENQFQMNLRDQPLPD